jgi:hypothetical protein
MPGEKVNAARGKSVDISETVSVADAVPTNE